MNEKKKVLIVGGLGMLGQELARVFSCDGQYAVTVWDKGDVDICDFPLLREKLSALQPALVMNAAAYNAVDACEEGEAAFAKAQLLNRGVPGFLAEMSRKLGFVLVHYSTDYVFDGVLATNEGKTGCCGGGCACSGSDSQVGYNEEALPNPLSRYGESKYAGERAVCAKTQTFYLIRLSKLFGTPGKSPQAKKSFFAVMLELTKTRPEVQAVDDEKSCFTYAPDLALATKELVESGDAFGTYHLMNEGPATWYEAAQELYRIAKKETKVLAVGSDVFPRPARRPRSSVLLNTKRPKLRDYREALKEFLQEME